MKRRTTHFPRYPAPQPEIGQSLSTSASLIAIADSRDSTTSVNSPSVRFREVGCLAGWSKWAQSRRFGLAARHVALSRSSSRSRGTVAPEPNWAAFSLRLCTSFNVMEIAKAAEVRHFILASTSSVYGANAKMPFRKVRGKSCHWIR
jgi:hypothetical protein